MQQLVKMLAVITNYLVITMQEALDRNSHAMRLVWCADVGWCAGGDTLLDLSAAFDWVDHDIVLHGLEVAFGLTNTALEWICSFLTDHTQQVSYCGRMSPIQCVLFSVPQGSVLGPCCMCFTPPSWNWSSHATAYVYVCFTACLTATSGKFSLSRMPPLDFLLQLDGGNTSRLCCASCTGFQSRVELTSNWHVLSSCLCLASGLGRASTSPALVYRQIVCCSTHIQHGRPSLERASVERRQ